MSENFFSRWSRCKQAAVSEAPAPAVPAVVTPVPAAPVAETPAVAEPAAPAAPLPTLEDVQALQPGAGVQPFMQRGVAPEVRNAAMKKLFADPHFNVMDGLDVYIDDYSLPDPMPAGMLRQMASAQFLKLVPEEAPARQGEPGQALPLNPASPDGIEVVAQSPDSSACADPPIHDNPDLQLQPDPAPADPQPGPGPR
jgi:hypothetical protein